MANIAENLKKALNEIHSKKLTDQQYAALLDLIMCSDPWPVDKEDNQIIIEALADEEAKARGFDGFIEAVHLFKPEKREKPKTQTPRERIIQRYVETFWSRCPYPGCGSADITGGPVEINGKVATQMCHCDECERSWQDQYTLSNAVLFDPITI